MKSIRNSYLSILLGSLLEAYVIVFNSSEWLYYIGFALCVIGGFVILHNQEGISEETKRSLRSNSNWQCFIILLLMFFKMEDLLVRLIGEFIFRAFLFTLFLRIILFFKRGSNNRNNNSNNQLPPTAPPRLT